MDKLVIEGGRKLSGEMVVSGAKNAVLPILAATLLTDEECIIRNAPKLRDSVTMVRLLRSLGKNVEMEGNSIKVSRGKNGTQYMADYKLVSTMRGSFCVLGPLLTKLGIAKVSLPGGCIIGVRPVDLHLKGLKALGAKMEVEGGYIIAKTKRLKGSSVYLGGVFGSSVLATANVMMAATLANGETIIECAACEPEVEDLANFLVSMGAKITGQGSPTITITGVKRLRGTDYKVIPDRIEAGTFILLAAATRSDLLIKNVRLNHLAALADKLSEAGLKLKEEGHAVRVKPVRSLSPVSITTHPHPGFPTDLQAQFMTLMALTPGVSIIADRVYPDRFMHIAELNRMGASIRREGINAVVEGVKHLYGAPVMASDLRASAALLIAGLAAKGKTEINRIYHLERGYEAIDQKLEQIGARVYREKE